MIVVGLVIFDLFIVATGIIVFLVGAGILDVEQFEEAFHSFYEERDA